MILERIEGGMDEIKDAVARTRMPVFRRVGDAFELGGNAREKGFAEGGGDERVGLSDLVEARSLVESLSKSALLLPLNIQRHGDFDKEPQTPVSACVWA